MTPKIKQIIDWTIPYYGNRHIIPYGTLIVSNGVDEKICKTKGDTEFDIGPQYITFKRKRYLIVNCDTMYSPKLKLENYE